MREICYTITVPEQIILQCNKQKVTDGIKVKNIITIISSVTI